MTDSSFRRLVRYCIAKIGIRYHPDSEFRGYYVEGTGQKLLPDSVADRLDRLHDAAFSVSRKAKRYDLARLEMERHFLGK